MKTEKEDASKDMDITIIIRSSVHTLKELDSVINNIDTALKPHNVGVAEKEIKINTVFEKTLNSIKVVYIELP